MIHGGEWWCSVIWQPDSGRTSTASADIWIGTFRRLIIGCSGPNDGGHTVHTRPQSVVMILNYTWHDHRRLLKSTPFLQLSLLFYALLLCASLLRLDSLCFSFMLWFSVLFIYALILCVFSSYFSVPLFYALHLCASFLRCTSSCFSHLRSVLLIHAMLLRVIFFTLCDSYSHIHTLLLCASLMLCFSVPVFRPASRCFSFALCDSQ